MNLKQMYHIDHILDNGQIFYVIKTVVFDIDAHMPWSMAYVNKDETLPPTVYLSEAMLFLTAASAQQFIDGDVALYN